MITDERRRLVRHCREACSIRAADCRTSPAPRGASGARWVTASPRRWTRAAASTAHPALRYAGNPYCWQPAAVGRDRAALVCAQGAGLDIEPVLSDEDIERLRTIFLGIAGPASPHLPLPAQKRRHEPPPPAPMLIRVLVPIPALVPTPAPALRCVWSFRRHFQGACMESTNIFR